MFLCLFSICYTERTRKIALNADKNKHDNQSSNANTFDFSLPDIQFQDNEEIDQINQYQQYPPSIASQTDQNKMECKQDTEDSVSPQNENENKKGSKKKKKKKKKKKGNQQNQEYRKQEAMKAKQAKMQYVNMLMVHEWMIDIPHDLTQNVCIFILALFIMNIYII